MTFASATRARLAAVALFSLAALPDCTCAGAERSQAYLTHLQSELDAYAHAGTREEVASDARKLLVDHGFRLPLWDGSSPATSDWKELGDDSRERMRVEASARDGGIAIRFSRERQDREAPHWTRDSRRRDHELEHVVLARIHPERAETVKAEDAGDVVYDVASSILWQSIVDVLGARGEHFTAWEPPVDVTVSSEWVVHDGDDPSRVRHDVQLVPVGKSGHRVQIHRTIERGVGRRAWVTADEHRDWDAELDLLRRRDPTTAGTIEAEARERGQEAFDQAVKHGALACSVHVDPRDRERRDAGGRRNPR